MSLTRGTEGKGRAQRIYSGRSDRQAGRSSNQRNKLSVSA
jgi:hypothetical protein